MAAATAYYAALSLFPLLLVLISAMGLLLRWTEWGHDAENQVLTAIGDYASPAVRNNVAEILDQVQRKAAISGPLSIGLLIFAAVTLFAHFEHAFDRIWNIRRPSAASIGDVIGNIAMFRLRAFLMLVSLFILILIVFVGGVVMSSLKSRAQDILPVSEWVWSTVGIGFGIVLNWGLFTLIYRFLPKVHVRWSSAAAGGLLAAVAWELGRLALTGLLVGKKYSAYGVVGSFIVVMLWIYFASTVVFMGAEYVQVICNDGDGGRRRSLRKETDSEGSDCDT